MYSRNDAIGTGRQAVNYLKTRAFSANRSAKLSSGQAREQFYRIKHAAINAALKENLAWVDSVDWSQPEPVFGITFVGGGTLHTKLMSLDGEALRSVRQQLNGGFTQDGVVAGSDGLREPRASAWN